MKPDRNYFATRVQQWAIDAVRAVAAEYHLTYGEALEKLVSTAKPILLEGLKEPTAAPLRDFATSPWPNWASVCARVRGAPNAKTVCDGSGVLPARKKP